MNYMPLYALVALVLVAAAALVAYRLVSRWRSARHHQAQSEQQARNAAIWAKRNDRRPH